MKTHYAISIPKPCHENWDKMIAEDKGKFCQSCSKSVIDFSQMPQQSIEDYLSKNSDKKLCGRFKVSQLAEIRIEIPQQLIEQQLSFHKLFLLALLIAMGTSLLNCSDKNGNTKKINVVEIVDTLKTEVIKIPDVSTPEVVIDSIKSKAIVKKPDSIKVHKIPIPNINGEVIEIMGDMVIEQPELNEEIIIGYLVVDRVPEFKDTPERLSDSEKKDYMSKRISEIVTENFNSDIGNDLGIKGRQRILTQFTIDKNGDVTNIKIRAPHPKLEEEALRVIKFLPQFIPGQQRNKNVAVVYTLPIVFVIED